MTTINHLPIISVIQGVVGRPGDQGTVAGPGHDEQLVITVHNTSPITTQLIE